MIYFQNHTLLFQVNGRSDSDFCEKSFNKKKDFSYGVFSIGCACKYNVTLGFELMLQKESAHNLFRYSLLFLLPCYLKLFLDSLCVVMWTCLTLRESFLTMHVDWIHISLIGIVIAIVSFYVCKAITFAESQENSSICVAWLTGPTGRAKNV